MFAIFFTPEMDRFYEIVSSFPTVLFSVFLILSIFYWLLAVLGLVDIDILDMDVGDIDADLPTSGNHDLTNLNVMSGLLLKLGLNGVPITIVITLIALIGWVISFLAVYFIYPLIPLSLIQFLLGIGILIGTLYIAAMCTAVLIKPLRPIFLASNQEVQVTILGQTAIVRTGEVTNDFGEATIEDGGAGLIIKVRPYKNEVFHRGDRVVLLEYIKDLNVYKVVSEADFKN